MRVLVKIDEFTFDMIFIESIYYWGVTGVEMTVSNRRSDLYQRALVNSRRGVCVLSLYVKRSFSIFIMKKTAVPLLKFTNKEVNYSEHSQRKLFFFYIIWMAQKKNLSKYCHEYSLYRNLKFCAYFIGLRLYGAPDPCNSNLHRRFWSKFPEYGCFTGTHIDFLITGTHIDFF